MSATVPRLTDQQQAAIDQRLASVSLSAGAGCGKTTVLTQRFLSHLDPGGPDTRGDAGWGQAGPPGVADLDQLVAITFTDAASREMRARIRAACRQQVISSAGKDADAWLGLLRRLDSARISTIHSFCATLLRQHGIDAGIDPGFDLLVPNDQRVVVGEVIDDYLRERLGARDESVIHLLAEFDFGRLKTTLRELVDGWNDRVVGQWLDATPDDVLAAWRKFIDQFLLPKSRAVLLADETLEQLLGMLRIIEPGKSAFAKNRAQLIPCCEAFLNGQGTLDDAAQMVANLRLTGLSNAKYLDVVGGYQPFKNVVEVIKSRLKAFPAPLTGEAELRRNIQLMLDVLQLSADMMARYRERKRELGRLDNDDLLRETHALLTDPSRAELRAKLARQTRLLLVDEFQDTDSLQMEIVAAVCNNMPAAGKLFCVGDIKQSIYRFRGAEPRVFLDLQDTMSEQGRLSLTENFRSQPEIIRFVNDLFHDQFDNYEQLNANRVQETARPCIEFLWTRFAQHENAQGRKTSSKVRTVDQRREEAFAVAERLRSLIDGGEPLIPTQDGQSNKKTMRPIECRDIVILFRALSDVHLYEKALQELDLDYYLVGGKAYYSQQEVFDILNLLKVVESSCDDIALAGVLRSPLFGIRDETLYSCVRQVGPLHQSLLQNQVPPGLLPEEQRRLRHAFATIQLLRREKDTRPIASLLELAIEQTGYDAVALAEFLGERKLANLLKLFEQAHQADQGGVQNLSGFIAQLEEFIANQPPEGLAATCPEDANVIRLMTVHHAKGLEFPCVVLVDIDRKDDSPITKASVHPQLGPLIGLPAKRKPKGNAKQTSDASSLYRPVEKQEEEKERARLFYVAITRAADYLILSASLSEERMEEPQTTWMKILSDKFDLHSGQLQGAAAGETDEPYVRVTTCDGDSSYTTKKKSRSVDLNQLLDEAKGRAELHPELPPPLILPVAPQTDRSGLIAASQLPGGNRVPRQLLGTPQHVPGTRTHVEPEGIEPLAVGSLCHLVLHHLLTRGHESVHACCDRLAPQFASQRAEEMARFVAAIVSGFIESPRAAAIRDGECLLTEVEFLLPWPTADREDDLSQPAPAGVRGFIDCLVEHEPGHWEVLDFKTDQHPPALGDTISSQYQLQLGVYGLAVESILGEPPRHVTLHFLQSGAEYCWEWSRVVQDRVKQALTGSISS